VTRSRCRHGDGSGHGRHRRRRLHHRKHQLRIAAPCRRRVSAAPRVNLAGVDIVPTRHHRDQCARRVRLRHDPPLHRLRPPSPTPRQHCSALPVRQVKGGHLFRFIAHAPRLAPAPNQRKARFTGRLRTPSVLLITYRNVPSLPAVRSDTFDSFEEAVEYVKKVEPTCPRVSLGGESPTPTPSWEEHLEWLHRQQSRSAAEGDQPQPDWQGSKGSR